MTRGMRIWRVVLVLAGIAIAVLGAWILVDTVAWVRILGLASWLAAAVVIHDALIAPGVFAVDLAMRRIAGRRVGTGAIAIVQGGIVVGSVFTLIVVPEIVSQSLGKGTATLLTPDYGMRLGAMWIVVAALTAAALVAYRLIRRRQKVRPSADQD
ncbi:hypothetical protein [Pseudolysinimonas sp.]|uniref:hypothetical protein n=1 Tax=Pseudolysinimonas sp. TaxID=2680009 RepID=UPI003F7FE18E